MMNSWTPLATQHKVAMTHVQQLRCRNSRDILSLKDKAQNLVDLDASGSKASEVMRHQGNSPRPATPALPGH
jgi:hypothetical protein